MFLQIKTSGLLFIMLISVFIIVSVEKIPVDVTDSTEIIFYEDILEARSLDSNESPLKEDEQYDPADWNKNEIIENLGYMTSPIVGASVSSQDSHLPGANRDYRNGTHQGVDYYNYNSGVTIKTGTPVVAAGPGKIIRADHNYEEISKEQVNEVLDETMDLESTPSETLDKLRGRQVWIRHSDGIVTRYAHLDSIESELTEGEYVNKGEQLGTAGNSGTPKSSERSDYGPHLHFEIWLSKDKYLGKDRQPRESREMLLEIFDH